VRFVRGGLVSAFPDLSGLLVAQSHMDPSQWTRPGKFHQSYFRGYDGDIPYNVAEVELDEGPRLLTNLVNVANDKIHAGMPVEIVFDDVTDEITLAKFKPSAA
jgi:hypothetical protein